jgi:penicillin-binding protein 2
MGGVWHHPHLMKARTKTDKPDIWALNPDNVRGVVDGMYGVVNEGGGTGGRARLPWVDVCGKTGSAQLASNEYLKGTAAGRNLKDNAWFEGFAPCHAPEIVVVALYDHGEHGQFAAPIVKDVMTAYFEKKMRLETEAKQREATLASKVAALGNMVLPVAAAPQPATPAPQHQ